MLNFQIHRETISTVAFPLHQDNLLVYWGCCNLFVKMKLFLVVIIPRSNCHCFSLNKRFWMRFADVIISGGCWIAEYCELLIDDSYLFSAHCVRLGLGLWGTFTSAFFCCGLYCHLHDSGWRFHFSRLPLSGRSFNSQVLRGVFSRLLLAPSRAVHPQLLSSDGAILCDLTVSLVCYGREFRFLAAFCIHLCVTTSNFPKFPPSSIKEMLPVYHGPVLGQRKRSSPTCQVTGQLIPSCSFLLIGNHVSDCSLEVSVMFSDPLMPVILALWACNLVNNTQLNHAWEERNVLWKGECFGKANYSKKEMKLN